MTSPNFFIVGAPKCGTSSLVSWLAAHPDIFMPALKEPKFFNTDHVELNRPTPGEYEELFNDAQGEKAIGEATAWYLYSQCAIRRILEYNPAAKFIVSVRDPVSMAFSMHNQAVFAGIEPLRDFQEAWRAQESRERGIDVPRGVDHAQLLYGPICRTGGQIARLHRLAGTDAVHIVFLDDMRHDPERTYREVLRFLQVSTEWSPAFRVANAAQVRRSPLLRQASRRLGAMKRSLGVRRGFGLLTRLDHWNRRPRTWAGDPLMIGELSSYFEEDVALLEQITGRDLSHWRRAS